MVASSSRPLLSRATARYTTTSQARGSTARPAAASTARSATCRRQLLRVLSIDQGLLAGGQRQPRRRA